MPVVSIGTASNLFHAFEESLGKHHGLDFSKVLSFMSDTTNVTKRVRSGVQKLINNRNPFMPYAGCICYLADLAVKAGMRALPVGVEQLFVDIFYHFQHSSKRKQEFNNLWTSLYASSYP